jgi:disulfide bond formation protein DsbB
VAGRRSKWRYLRVFCLLGAGLGLALTLGLSAFQRHGGRSLLVLCYSRRVEMTMGTIA